MTNETTTAPAAVVPSVSTVDLTLSDDPLDDACAGDKTPAARLRAAAAALRDRERSARDLDEHCEHPFRCSTRLPEGWIPDEAVRSAMRQEYPGLPDDWWRREHEKFANHFLAAPGQRGLKRDWNATWRNWIHLAAAAVSE